MGNRIGRDTLSSQHLVLLPDGYYSSAKRISYRGEKAHEGTQVIISIHVRIQTSYIPGWGRGEYVSDW